MSSPFVAEIKMWGGNFAPTGYASCNGQILPISQNTALFSLLGTMYGGDGKSTFALPDMAGNAPMHSGQGDGLSQRFVGEESGVPYVTLIQSEMPVHTHQMTAYVDDPADIAGPSPAVVFGLAQGLTPWRANSDSTMGPQQLAIAGSSLPHNNMQPYLAVFFIIALQGVFPPRG